MFRAIVVVAVGLVTAAGVWADVRRAAVAAEPPPASTPGIFGLTAPGQRFVYVFDRSASMSEPQGLPLAAAKRELLASIEALGDARQFHLIFYNERPTIYAPRGGKGRPIFADEEQVREVRRFVADVRADGGTRHHEALAAALRLKPDVIFMLTDADAEDDLSEDELGWLSRSLSGTRCMVVQFGAAAGRRSPRLARLAAESGGTYKVMDPDVGP